MRRRRKRRGGGDAHDRRHRARHRRFDRRDRVGAAGLLGGRRELYGVERSQVERQLTLSQAMHRAAETAVGVERALHGTAEAATEAKEGERGGEVRRRRASRAG